MIEKKSHQLLLLNRGRTIATYRVSLGSKAEGSKVQQGDGLTPEGNYYIDDRNEHSIFYKSLHISYPNEADRARAKKLGVQPGGDIMIHGMRSGLGWLGPLHRFIDWTKGCIAVTDQEMDEIWARVATGTAVEIKS